jgi:glutamyl-tRNA synthetase
MLPYLQEAGLVADPASSDEVSLLAAATPLVQERIALLSEVVPMLGFLFVSEEAFDRDPDAAAKNLGEGAAPALGAAVAALEPLPTWQADAIKEALESALVTGLGLKPRHAFTPLRVAITGRTVSPPLFESMELLGRDRSLARLRSALG